MFWTSVEVGQESKKGHFLEWKEGTKNQKVRAIKYVYIIIKEASHTECAQHARVTEIFKSVS